MVANDLISVARSLQTIKAKFANQLLFSKFQFIAMVWLSLPFSLGDKFYGPTVLEKIN